MSTALLVVLAPSMAIATRLAVGDPPVFRANAWNGVVLGDEIEMSGLRYVVTAIESASTASQRFAAELEGMAAARGGWLGLQRRDLALTAIEVTPDRITWALR